MNEYRENPESEENAKMTKQNEREVFALQMQRNHPLEIRISELEDHLDLMVDEFMRIKGISCSTSEVQSICDRAIDQTKQNVPMIARVAQLEKKVNAAKELHDFLWKNSGTTDEWPIDIVARDKDSADELTRLLSNLKTELEA